ncbi:hypothetical protein GGI07_000920 [Coemansia sp. Benny D115]|nr:hypothetical protein GGI07_000920 [Coemansia sp. Benny D115]
MSPRPKTRAGSRPTTPANLGLSVNTNIPPNNVTPTQTKRSVSNSSSASAKGVAPCFHTNRPQFISSHIERCEACRLKYARQAEQTTRPYSPLGMRRTSGAPPRSGSRQSLGGPNRPSSAASMVSLSSPTIATPMMAAATASAAASPTTTIPLGASMRPSSRASATSSKTTDSSRLSVTGGAMRPKHNRSSSAGSPLLSDKANIRRALARATDKMNIDSSVNDLMLPPFRGDPTMSPPSSSDGMPVSPTESMAIRSRNRAARQIGKAPGQAPREGLGNGAKQAGSLPSREARRGSAHSINPYRRAGNESPTKSIKSVRNKAAMSPTAPRAGHRGDDGDEKYSVINPEDLMQAMFVSKRQDEQTMSTMDARIKQLDEENRRLRLLVAQAADAKTEDAPSMVSSNNNIFGVSSAAAKQEAQEHTEKLDKQAFDMFEEFQKMYNECESTFSSNRLHFAGERPLSPPPKRLWNGSVSTPMRSSIDAADHDMRLSSLSVAEVRRAGQELLSTPVRSKAQRIIRTVSTRRPTRSRINQPLFDDNSDNSDNGIDSDDFNDDDDHLNLRSCLISASRFGKFLVQYITRQCNELNTLAEENGQLDIRAKEFEKKIGQLEKLNRRLEEIRDEQAAQSYEMSAQREMLREKLDAADRNARKQSNENERLKQDLITSNERVLKLEDQLTKVNSDVVKTRQRLDHEITNLRRNSNTLQQEKASLTKLNDELRVELKGKLQRAGLKANVDEYLAERRKAIADGETTAAAADEADSQRNLDAATVPSTPTTAKPVDESKKVKELTQFFHRKLEKAKRRLQSEKVARTEIERILRVQQEETHRYRQMYGLLPDDMLFDGMETLGDFMPDGPATNANAQGGGMMRLQSDLQASGMLSNDVDDSDSNSDSPILDIGTRTRAGVGAGASGITRADAGIDGISIDDGASIADDADSIADSGTGFLVSPEMHDLSRVGSHSSLSSNGEDADEAAIRRFEQRKMRLQQQRAAVSTPRGRKVPGNRTPRTMSSRRNKNSLLSIDIEAAGESLGDILGASGQWGDPMSSRSKTSMRGQLSARLAEPSGSLASELGGNFMDDNASIKSFETTSPTRRHRTRSSRGSRAMPSPFGDSLSGNNGFGISYDESVSLAEQLALATPKIKSRAATVVFDRPTMVDASTSTDPMPVTQTEAAGVQANVPLPSAEVSVATANTEANSMVAIAVQSVSTTVESQSATDPLMGVRACGVSAAPEVSSTCVGTDISAFNMAHRGIDSTQTVVSNGVQAVFENSSVSTETDPRIGVVDAITGLDIQYHSQGCQAQAECVDSAVLTDRMYGMRHQGMEAVSAMRDTGVSTSTGPMCDSAVATVGPTLVDRGLATVPPSTADSSAATPSLYTSDSHISTDDSLIINWLAPLIPDGISVATVLAALYGRGEPVYELFRRQVADTTRSEAFAEYERLAAADAERAAEQAAAQVKVYVDKGVSSEITTGEQSVQAEPRQASKVVQAGSLAVASVGVDACLGPTVIDAGVGTESQSITRWVEPFDPVQKVAKGVLAVAATAERSTSRDIEYADASLGPTHTVGHKSVDACVEATEQSTSTNIVLTDAATGSDIKYRDHAVDSGLGKLVSVGVDCLAEVADKATSNVAVSCSRFVDAETAATLVAGTQTATTRAVEAQTATAAVADKSEGPSRAVSDQGTKTEAAVAVPSVVIVDAGVQAEPKLVDVGVATIVTPASMSTDSVNVERHVADVGVETEAEALTPEPVVAAVSTSDTSADRAIGSPSLTHADEADSNAMIESEAERESETAEANARAEPSNSLGLVDTVSPVAAAAAVVSSVQRRAPPTQRLPSVPSLSLQRSANKLADSPNDFGIQFSSPNNVATIPMYNPSEAVERESDHEDYGYIMVSPRTNVQRIPVSAISSSHNNSLAASSASVHEQRGVTDLRDGSVYYQDGGHNSADERILGRDMLDEDADVGEPSGISALGNEDGGEMDAVSSLRAHTFGSAEGTSAVSEATDIEDKRQSVTIGVDATEQQVQTYISRQPQPLIVQAIARTMVGAFLWKYTTTHFPHNNSGRERRHMRYFWIHPYAKILNWSKQPPSSSTSHTRTTRDSGSRSAYMRSIRIVAENSQYGGFGESGLEPEYCIVVRTEHREIKLKATTQADHDLWFLAMSYLQSRRIITSTTYPTMSAVNGSVARHPEEYLSDHSLRSRATSNASMDSNQRIILDADRRHRTGERSSSRSRSRSRPRGPLHSQHVSGRSADYPPVPQHSTVSHGMMCSSGGYSSSVAGSSASLMPPPSTVAYRSQPGQQQAHNLHHRNTAGDVAPVRMQSLQATPRSLRPVSMVPSTTPGSGESRHSKRLSIGLFRRAAGTSSTSLFRHGSHMSEESSMQLSPPLHPVGGTVHHEDSGSSHHAPQSIAATMMNRKNSSSIAVNSAASAASSGSSASVRKMFSGTFLRGLRSRESVNEPGA